jgi:hypothetical protein
MAERVTSVFGGHNLKFLPSIIWPLKAVVRRSSANVISQGRLGGPRILYQLGVYLLGAQGGCFAGRDGLGQRT